MACWMPGPGDGVDDVGKRLTKDEEETCEPEMNAALRVTATEKEKKNKQDAECCRVRNEMEIHERGLSDNAQERETGQPG